MIDKASATQPQQVGHPGVMSSEAIPTLLAHINLFCHQINELCGALQSNASAL